MPDTTATIDTVEKDIGTTPFDQVKRWKTELELAKKAVEDWHKSGEEVVKRYRDEDGDKYNRFNVLWANTETFKPALFGQVPRPDIRRRITDPTNPDPVGRAAATVLERGVAFSVDDYDFKGLMKQAVEDYLLPGRAIARVHYIPTMSLGEPPRIPIEAVENQFNDFGTPTGRRFMVGGEEVSVEKVNGAENLPLGAELDSLSEDVRPFTLGEPEEEVVNEEVRCEYVDWKDYLESPARTWAEVRWVSFRSRMTRTELRDEFGKEIADKVTLDWVPTGVDPKDNVAEFFKKATVWEIWNKETRTRIFIAEGYDASPLAERGDPLTLDGFFPNPRPLDFVTTNGSRIPIPIYKVYQNQAEELNTITERINKLTAMLKVRGIFDKVEEAIGQLLKKPDGTLVGIDNFAELIEKGGLDRLISFLPIDQIAKVLQVLYVQREQIKRIIQELIGLSDIQRGQSDPRETKGAQVIKAEFGALRLQNPQDEVQRFILDLYRLKAEVMAEHFSQDTLRQMSGLELPGEEQRAQALEKLQANQKDSEAAELLSKPTWDQVLDLLREDGARGFRIDVETDTTIQPDAGKAKQEAVEMMQAVAAFIKETLPVVQAAPMMAPLAGQLLRLLLRQFKPGRLVEEALEQALLELERAAKQPKQEGPTPEQQAEEAKAKREQEAVGEKLKLDKAKHDEEMKVKREELEMKRESAQGDRELKQDEIMGKFGPSIVDAMERAQASMAAGQQQNAQTLAVAVQALVAVTQNLNAAIQTVGGEKEIVFEGSGKNRRPVGIRPVTSAGQTIN